MSTSLNLSFFVCACLLSGCISSPVAPAYQPTQESTQQSVEQSRVEPPRQQVIPLKTPSNALSLSAIKPKPSLGLVVANHKSLNGALVLRFDSYKGVSPGEQAGVKKGDLITWIGGCFVKTIAEYFVCLEKYKPFQPAQISFDRDGVLQKKMIVLGERY